VLLLLLLLLLVPRNVDASPPESISRELETPLVSCLVKILWREVFWQRRLEGTLMDDDVGPAIGVRHGDKLSETSRSRKCVDIYRLIQQHRMYKLRHLRPITDSETSKLNANWKSI
jgi:hypothetical protein